MDFAELLGKPDCEARVDIVTVHGLHRAGNEPWQDTDERPKWLEKDLLNNFDVRVIVFNYKEVENGVNIYTKRGIILVAQQLLDSLMSWRRSNDESCRPLAFISHDIGGVIVKQALLLASKQHEKYKSVLQPLYALIFVNCPHRAASHVSLFDSLVFLVCNTKIPSSGILESVKSLCSAIIVTNDEFADSTILLHTRVASVYSEHSERSQRVFHKNTATIGFTCEIAVPLPGVHATLIVGEDGNGSHKALRNTLELSTSSEYDITVWPVSESLHGLRLLDSSSAVQPLCRFGEQQSRANVLEFSHFTKWIQQQEDHHRARWILTSKDYSVPINSFDGLLQKWGEDAHCPKVVMFTCDLSNYRRLPQNREDNDSITRLILATQLSQAITYLLPRTKPAKRPENIINRLKDSRGLMHCQHLLDLFEHVNLWLKEGDIQAIWGIWNIHKCPHNQQALLIRRLTKCFEFSEFKPSILFVGNDDSEQKLAHIMEEANVPRFEQVSMYPSLGDPSHAPEVEKLRSLLEGRLEIRCLFEQAVKRANNPPFIKTLACWIHGTLENGLASKATERRITSLLEEVCTKPSKLFQIIIKSLSDDQRIRALQILCWVTYSLQPLSPHQLSQALLTMDMESIEEEVASHEVKPNDEKAPDHFIYPILLELQQRLYYMIEIECNEVRLSHPTVSKFLSSYEFEARLDPAESNLHIFKYLLSHISGRASSMPFIESQASPFFSRPYDLTWYAIQYWPQHYRITREYPSTVKRADECLKAFFENQEHAVKHLLRVSGEVNSPSTVSEDQTSLEVLRVLIRCNLYKISGLDDIFKCRPWDFNIAITELVQCGDLDLLRTLPFDSLTQQQVERILERAVEGNSTVETMEYLFQQAKDRVPLPFPFLIQLVQVGATDAVKIACENQKLGIKEHNTLLLTAIQSQHKRMTEMLLKRRTISSDDGVLEIVKEACRIGDPTQLRSVLNLVSREQRHKDLLYYACSRGNHLVVRNLLQDFNSKNDEHRAQLQVNPKLALTRTVERGFMKCTLEVLQHYDANRDQEKLFEAIDIALMNAKVPQRTFQLLFKPGTDFSEEQISNLLRAAIHKGRLDLVEMIFDHCGGINSRNCDGETPLFMAASDGHLRIAEYLLDIGADVNASDCYGLTPIFMACDRNHPPVVSLLLSRGADVTLASAHQNWSPLEVSYNEPNLIEMIATIASPPPDYRRVTTDGDYTALWLAAKHNHVESVRLLLDNGDPDLEFAPSSENSGVKAGVTALVYTAWKGFDEIVRLLLEKGANVNHRYNHSAGSPILHLVNSDTTMAILLEYNPNLEATDSNGRSILNKMAAESEPRMFTIRRLVNAGANLESKDNNGDTPLCNAVISENYDVIKYLVSKGAHINTLKPKWGSPIHYVAIFGKEKFINMLVELGGYPHIEHNYVGSPLQAACMGLRDKEIAEYLVGKLKVELNTAGSITCTVFGQACRTGSLEMVRYLVHHGVNTTATSRSGIPSVFNLCARQAGAVEVLEELLSRDIPIWTERDFLGRNILHVAVMGGSKELVQILLKGQPDLLRERDKDGWTVLHWAARRARLHSKNEEYSWPSESVRKEIVELLLENECPGMDERVAIGEKSWTPGDPARHHEKSESVLEAFSIKESEGENHADQAYGDEWNCDCCFAQVRGILHRCKEEICYKNFGLCFRCFPYKAVCHDPEHEFEELGEEFKD
ncbi:ankyrin repeat-containing domain protein [Xylaria cf. heliscus]|nr:ankyrin repeat-containing domain protein [Xylaria cf. heliscus]